MSNMDVNSALATKVRKQIVEAMAEYNMLSEGDHVMVCVSGGKDSAILAILLNEIRKRAPYHFTMEAVMLDQVQPGFKPEPFVNWIQNLGIKFTMIQRDTYSIVKEKITDGVYCSLCSRLRRGILYDHAFENKFTKMALGHHRDDLSETLLLNLFYTGRLASMPPKLRSDDGRNILIRPLSFVPEAELMQLSQEWQIPILPCNLCGSQEGMKRKKIKALIRNLEKEIPFIGNSMLKALSNVHESQLMDKSLWDFDQFTGENLESVKANKKNLEVDHLSGNILN